MIIQPRKLDVDYKVLQCTRTLSRARSQFQRSLLKITPLWDTFFHGYPCQTPRCSNGFTGYAIFHLLLVFYKQDSFDKFTSRRINLLDHSTRAFDALRTRLRDRYFSAFPISLPQKLNPT